MAATNDNFLRKAQRKIQEIEGRQRELTMELESLSIEHERYLAARQVYEQEMAGKLNEASTKRTKAQRPKKRTVGDHLEKVLQDADGPMGTKQLFGKLLETKAVNGKSAYSTVVRVLSRDPRFSQVKRGQWDLASRRLPLPIRTAEAVAR